jgi:predicted small secreted protein
MAIPDYLKDTVKDYADQASATYSAPINTDMFTGSQFVAGEDPLQTQAINMAQQGVGSYQPYLTAAHQLGNMGINALGGAQNTLSGVGGTINQAGSALGQAGAAYGGMGGYQAAGGAAAQNAANIAGGAAGMTGPNAYKQFMSPYQQQVIDATLAEYDKQGAAGAQSIKDQAVNSGNFGGGREGAQLGQYQSDRLADRAALQGSMLEKGFGQANQLAQQNFANQGALFGMQQGLGGMASNLFNQQGQMGAAQQSLANSQLNRGQAMQGLSAAQRGISDAYGDQINRQFNMGNFARQGMGQDISALGSMGAIRQGMNQAQLTAEQNRLRTGAYEPYGRLTQFGNVLTGLGGGYADNSIKIPDQAAILSSQLGS